MKTIFLAAKKISDSAFTIDVLYFDNTSYSKSLYPTIERYFKKYAEEYFGGGKFTSPVKTAPLFGGDNSDGYAIMRVTYTKID